MVYDWKSRDEKLPNKCIISHIIIYCPMERKLNILWFFFWWYWLCLCWVRNPAFYVISFDYHYCRGNGIMHLPYITYCLLLYKGTTCLLHSLSLFTGCLIRRLIKIKLINIFIHVYINIYMYRVLWYLIKYKIINCINVPSLLLKWEYSDI